MWGLECPAGMGGMSLDLHGRVRIRRDVNLTVETQSADPVTTGFSALWVL